MNHRIEAPSEKLAGFCRKWKITELSLFGSVLREDFRSDSDIDVLVTFAPEARWSLLDLPRMQEERFSLPGRWFMLPEERDPAYLWDMRDAARDIVGWVQGVNYGQFCNNEMLHSAV